MKGDDDREASSQLREKLYNYIKGLLSLLSKVELNSLLIIMRAKSTLLKSLSNRRLFELYQTLAIHYNANISNQLYRTISNLVYSQLLFKCIYYQGIYYQGAAPLLYIGERQ